MNKYIILGHENPDYDSIASGYLLEKLMKKLGYDVEFIIPDEEISDENLMLSEQTNLNPKEKQKPLIENAKYILVDHHERDVPGEIVAIIDHHPTDKDIKCKYYQNTKSSSTACLIAREYEEFFDKNDLLTAVFSAMVDTAAFHSPTKINESDIPWAKQICQKYNFNYQELLTLSMCPSDISNLKQASLNGQKNHYIHGHKITSSFLHLPHPEEHQEEIETMLDYIKDYLNETESEMFLFIIHDITNFKSRLYQVTPNAVQIKDYEEYASRGSKIIPELTEELKTYQKKKVAE